MLRSIFSRNQEYPAWFKMTIILLGLVLAYIILLFGKFVLIPLAFSALFAMLLEPVSRYLEKLWVGRAIAIVLSMIFVFIGLAGFFSLLSIQFLQFSERLPEVNEKLQSVSSEILLFFQQNFGISPERQVEFVRQGLGDFINQSGETLGSALGATTSAFVTLALLPIFIFFLMYYKDMYRNFLHMISDEEHSESINTVLSNIQMVTQNYVVGLISVIGIMAVLNALGFWVIGLENALFFGVFAAIWAIIPYIGIVIGSLPAFLFAFLFTDSLLIPLGVLGVISMVQFLEGNFITPNIIGSKVSINPFVALLALIIGGEIWGIAGMILFVPFVGILRSIFMAVDGLEPYGYLLGTQRDYDVEIKEKEKELEESKESLPKEEQTSS